MVQRKKQSKQLASGAELSGKRLSSHQQQDTRTKLSRGDPKRKSSKPSLPNKASDGSPNYMKPTSSSGTRKQQLQVTNNSSITTDNNRMAKHLNNSNSSKPSSSLVGPRAELAKSLVRNSSLKPVRSSMKKSSGMGMYTKKNASRTTCTSTQKDSKFPNYLELNSGGTELEGTSIVEVCPYTHCSLNGHKHETLPPLNCFLSARRRLLKSKKSMKLRRMSSLIALSRIPTVLSINPLFDDLSDDFFAHAHGKPQAQFTNPDGHEERSNQGENDIKNPEIPNGISLLEDDWEFAMNQIYESSLNIDYKDDLDLSSYLSNEEMNALMDNQEYVEFDQKFEAKKDFSILLPVDYIVSDSACNMVNTLTNDCEGPAENKANASTKFEASNMPCENLVAYPNSYTDYSENLDDALNPICGPLIGIEKAGDGWLLDHESSSLTSEIAGADAEVSDEGTLVEIVDKKLAGIILCEGFIEEHNANKGEIVSSISPKGCAETDQDITDFGCINTKSSQDTEDFDPIRTEIKIKDYISNNQSDENSRGVNNPEDCTEVTDVLKTKANINYDADGTFPAVSFDSPAGDETVITPTLTSAEHLEVSGKSVRYGVIRQKETEDVSQTRAFNPRAPRFLPVEPEEGTEKVGLRHQQMDGRKSAEEWMIDYALQEVITKLAPDRERKVELLVEAFETVVLLLTNEAPLEAVSCLTTSKHVQACS